ncbi:hypothetical protein D3C87_1733090 [compost metagenome]
MTHAQRDQHILMKLANPEAFAVGDSYWHEKLFFKSEGWLEDTDQLGFSGEEFHNGLSFFALHSVFHGHAAFDYRDSDEDRYQDDPYVLIITGDHTLLCMFLRFATYWELLDWVANPSFDKDEHKFYCIY